MKKILILVFIAALILTFVIGIFAHTGNDALVQVLYKMEETDNKYSSLEVDYIQEILYTSTKEKQVIKGNLKFSKPKDIFIVQYTPQEQRIYLDGSKLITYSPQNMQAIESNWQDMIAGDFTPVSMIRFGSNWKKISRTNFINLIDETDKNYVLEIIPFKGKQWSMKMYVSKENMRPYKAVIGSDGAEIKIDLSNYKLDQNFDKKIFKFTPPSGVEIIKLD